MVVVGITAVEEEVRIRGMKRDNSMRRGSGMVAGSKTRTGHQFRRPGVVPTVSYFAVKSCTQRDVS